MDLLPFHSICAACICKEATTRFCTERCEATAPGAYEVVSRIGDTPKPHLHRVCKECGFEWLERCLGIQEVQREENEKSPLDSDTRGSEANGGDRT